MKVKSRGTMRRTAKAPAGEGWSAQIHTLDLLSMQISWSLALEKSLNFDSVVCPSLYHQHYVALLKYYSTRYLLLWQKSNINRGNSWSWETRARSLEMFASVIGTWHVNTPEGKSKGGRLWKRPLFWSEKKIVEINSNHWGGNSKRGQIVGEIGLGGRGNSCICRSPDFHKLQL